MHGASPSGFGAFKIHVADQLTEPFIERLANYFQFLPALKEKTRGNGLAFVNALLDNGTITEADISRLLIALKDVQLGGLKLTIEQKFMEYMRVAPQGK